MRLHLFEQPNVFDGDDCLVGEALHKRDLAFRKALRLRPSQGDYAEDRVAALQRRREDAAIIAKTMLGEGAEPGIAERVFDVDDLAKKGGARAHDL